MKRATSIRTSSFVALALLAVVYAVAVGQEAPARPKNHDWPVYLGDKGATHYSALDQINKDNVSRLRVAWTHDTSDMGEFQSNGLVIDGVLFTAWPSHKVIALNAATGERIWTFDPSSERSAGTAGALAEVAWSGNVDIPLVLCVLAAAAIVMALAARPFLTIQRRNPFRLPGKSSMRRVEVPCT